MSFKFYHGCYAANLDKFSEDSHKESLKIKWNYSGDRSVRLM